MAIQHTQNAAADTAAFFRGTETNRLERQNRQNRQAGNTGLRSLPTVASRPHVQPLRLDDQIAQAADVALTFQHHSLAFR